MKKTLKTIGWTLLIIIAIPLITALFITKDFNHEVSIQINAPIESVWQHTNSLAALDTWSPWIKIDPNMKSSIFGTDGTIGAYQSWESENKDVGKGKQTIVKIDAPNCLDTKLDFYWPHEAEADAYIKLNKNGRGTEVIWGFKSVMPYPVNLMMLLPNTTMKETFADGLGKLKMISESVQ
jgi:uncharacterized protein YxeA